MTVSLSNIVAAVFGLKSTIFHKRVNARRSWRIIGVTSLEYQRRNGRLLPLHDLLTQLLECSQPQHAHSTFSTVEPNSDFGVTEPL